MPNECILENSDLVYFSCFTDEEIEDWLKKIVDPGLEPWYPPLPIPTTFLGMLSGDHFPPGLTARN